MLSVTKEDNGYNINVIRPVMQRLVRRLDAGTRLIVSPADVNDASRYIKTTSTWVDLLRMIR